jgi:hypothetical protein
MTTYKTARLERQQELETLRRQLAKARAAAVAECIMAAEKVAAKHAGLDYCQQRNGYDGAIQVIESLKTLIQSGGQIAHDEGGGAVAAVRTPTPTSLHWLGDKHEGTGCAKDARGCVAYFTTQADCVAFMAAISALSPQVANDEGGGAVAAVQSDGETDDRSEIRPRMAAQGSEDGPTTLAHRGNPLADIPQD